MKRRAMPLLVVILVILIAAAGYFSVPYVEKYIPTKERADLNQFFGVDGDQVALILNEELQAEKGIFVDGQTYLPVAWVNEYLNERFYWDSVEKLLVYALPDTIVYADSETMGSTGKPLIVVDGEDMWISIGLVANYTDIRLAAFDSGELKRVYINSSWNEEQNTVSVKDGKLRVLGGIKSPIVADIQNGTKIKVLNSMDKWSYVRTEDGYMGYLPNRTLGETQTEKPVSNFIAPVYKNQTMDEKVRLVWHLVTNMEANEYLEDLIANTEGVNVIVPTWYGVTDNSGSYHSLASKSYVEKAHEMGLKVWAMVDNFNWDKDNQVKTELLLSPTSNRKKLIADLMNEVDTYNLDGLNMDFETIPKEAGPHYVQFIRELSVACRQKGIVLSVDNYVPSESSVYYNRKEQGIVADYVIVMGYDEHYPGGDMGSVASLGFVKKGIEDTLEVVPKEKLINGIPLFTRVWRTEDGKTKSSALGIADAKKWVEDNNVELTWDDELGQYYGEFEGDNGKRYVWMEEEKSIGLKMDLIKQYDLAGVACWRLGFEPKELWDVISR